MFHGRPGSAWLAGIALAGASCLAVTACAGPAASSHSTAAAASTTPAASTAAAARTAAASPADPLKALTGSQVETEAVANLLAAPNVTLAGTMTDSGTKYVLNLGIKRGHGCTGTIAMGNQGSFKLLVVGKVVYFNPDTRFWKANAGAEASAVISLINGRYIKTTTSADGMSSLASLCGLQQVLGSIKDSGTAPKRPVTTLHGVRVLPLANADGSVLYVTDTSKPQIVEGYAPGAGGGTLTFSQDTPVNLTPPLASEVIDGSAVGM
jgi:hypothetical protein